MKKLIFSFIILVVHLPVVLFAQEEPFLLGRSYKPQTHYNSSSGLLLIPKIRVDGEHVFINAYLTLKGDKTYELSNYGLKKLNEEEVLLANRIQSRPCGLADTLGRFSAYRSVNNQEEFCLVKSFSTVEGDRIVTYLFIGKNSIQMIIDYRNDKNGGGRTFDSSLYETVEFGYMDNNEFIKEEILGNIKFERDYFLRLTGDNIVRIY